MPGYDQRITNSTNTPLSGRFSKTGKAVSSGGNSSAATQVQGRAQGVNFSQGQFVRGEVIDLRGHEIKIQLPDSHVLTGNIDDAVQLAIGEQATFRVTEASGSLVSLKLMTDPRAASTELTIDKALDAAGLPRSERNVSMVRALLDEGLSVDKNTIQLMLRQSANLRGISFHTLAILHKQGLPVNEVNARALTSYLNYEHRIMQLAERAAGEFTDTLSSLLNGGNAAEAEVLNSELLHMLFDNNNISGGDTAHGANINTSALDIAGGTSLPNLPAADLPLSSLALLTQEEALTLADTLEQAGLSRELCAAVANGSATLREVVQQILSLAENLLQNQNPSGGQTEMGGIATPDGTVNNTEGAPTLPGTDAASPDTMVPDTTENAAQKSDVPNTLAENTAEGTVEISESAGKAGVNNEDSAASPGNVMDKSKNTAAAGNTASPENAAGKASQPSTVASLFRSLLQSAGNLFGGNNAAKATNMQAPAPTPLSAILPEAASLLPTALQTAEIFSLINQFSALCLNRSELGAILPKAKRLELSNLLKDKLSASARKELEDGDITAHLQPFLNFKAPGSGDVLQVHAAKTPGQQPDRFHDLIHVLAADAERNRVHIAEGLEQHAFPLHDGHSRFWANITQAQHRRTVGHHRHGVPAAGQVVAFVDVLLDFKTGLRHAGRIGQTQGLLGVHCRPGRNFQLAPQRIVHFQRFLCVIHHSFRLSCYFRCCIVWDFRRDRN